MVEDANRVGYTSSPVSKLRSLGLMLGAVQMRDSGVIRESNEALGSPNLNATMMVWRGSIKNPSESLGNTYKLGLNSSWSKERNLVASEEASTPTGTGAGGGLPTGTCSHSIGSRSLWIIGRTVPPAVTIAM